MDYTIGNLANLKSLELLDVSSCSSLDKTNALCEVYKDHSYQTMIPFGELGNIDMIEPTLDSGIRLDSLCQNEINDVEMDAYHNTEPTCNSLCQKVISDVKMSSIDKIEPNSLEDKETNFTLSQRSRRSISSRKQTYKHYFTSLKKFIRIATRRSDGAKYIKPVKNENVRSTLIRMHKKAIRKALIGELPRKKLIKINPKNIAQVEAWQVFKNCTLMDIIFFSNIAQTEKDPIVNAKKQNGENNKCARSFNNEFCAEYFKDSKVQESFLLLADFIFVDKTPEEYCEDFGFKCCEGICHQGCEKYWKMFETEVKTEFIAAQIYRGPSEATYKN